MGGVCHLHLPWHPGEIARIHPSLLLCALPCRRLPPSLALNYCPHSPPSYLAPCLQDVLSSAHHWNPASPPLPAKRIGERTAVILPYCRHPVVSRACCAHHRTSRPSPCLQSVLSSVPQTSCIHPWLAPPRLPLPAPACPLALSAERIAERTAGMLPHPTPPVPACPLTFVCRAYCRAYRGHPAVPRAPDQVHAGERCHHAGTRGVGVPTAGVSRGYDGEGGTWRRRGRGEREVKLERVAFGVLSAGACRAMMGESRLC